MLISAPGDDTGRTEAGVAYLFDLDGALLTTFTNPMPASSGDFGRSVAVVGTDRVLIGASNNRAGGTVAGEAYLFSTNGALLTTFTNPTPAYVDEFGGSVDAVGTDWALVGAPHDDTTATDAGAAYLFSLEQSAAGPPSLRIALDPELSNLTVSWSVPAEGWALERTNALPSATVVSWPQVPEPYKTNGGTISVTFTNHPAIGNQFFRLHKQ